MYRRNVEKMDTCYQEVREVGSKWSWWSYNIRLIGSFQMEIDRHGSLEQISVLTSSIRTHWFWLWNWSEHGASDKSMMSLVSFTLLWRSLKSPEVFRCNLGVDCLSQVVVEFQTLLSKWIEQSSAWLVNLGESLVVNWKRLDCELLEVKNYL